MKLWPLWGGEQEGGADLCVCISVASVPETAADRSRFEARLPIPSDMEDPLEKEMATHSSTLAWRVPWTEELCKLQSMGSQRVGHN